MHLRRRNRVVKLRLSKRAYERLGRIADANDRTLQGLLEEAASRMISAGRAHSPRGASNRHHNSMAEAPGYL